MDINRGFQDLGAGIFIQIRSSSAGVGLVLLAPVIFLAGVASRCECAEGRNR